MNRKITVYWAGALFNQKDLTGNLLLAKKVEERSGGRFSVLLPQVHEPEFFDASAIRDANYRDLIRCDLFLANFDGAELDPGTVMEFSCAKMFDIPAVLFRTDFRYCADHGTSSDPWSLMCSRFPRTKTVLTDSMRDLFFLMKSAPPREALNAFHESMADRIVSALDRALNTPSLCGSTAEEVSRHYESACRLLGGKVRDLFTDSEFKEMIRRKIQNGLYQSPGMTLS